MKAAGIILAAGASRRLGSPKQLAMVRGERLLERAVRTCVAAELSPIIVVLGSNADLIEAECDLGGAVAIKNTDWNAGAASSVRAGIQAAQAKDIDAAVIMTCDMPFVTAEHLRALLLLAASSRQNVGSAATNWHGVPACFLRTSFQSLLALQGDTGARTLLRGAITVPLADASDIDTVEDLTAANEV